jgi:hypothetical protein
MLWRKPFATWSQVPGFASTVSSPSLSFALKEMQDGRHRGGVFGQFLALGKAEQDRLEPVVVEQRAAQDVLVRRLGLLRQIDEQRVSRP